MTRTLTCNRCSTEVPVAGPSVVCPDCGERYDLDGLVAPRDGGSTSKRTEKEEQLAGKTLMGVYRPRAKVYDTSQPHRAMITPGLPDWLVFDPELGFFFYEWKAVGETLTEPQREFRNRCREADVPYHHGPVSVLAELLELDGSPSS